MSRVPGLQAGRVHHGPDGRSGEIDGVDDERGGPPLRAACDDPQPAERFGSKVRSNRAAGVAAVASAGRSEGGRQYARQLAAMMQRVRARAALEHRSGRPRPSTWRTPAVPRIGELLGGRYVLARAIGEGGMATVYEASDALTGERVAAKVLHRIHLGRTEIRQRFEFEARLTEGLEHPNATIECLLTRPPTPIATLCPTLPQGALVGRSPRPRVLSWRAVRDHRGSGEGPSALRRARVRVMNAWRDRWRRGGGVTTRGGAFSSTRQPREHRRSPPGASWRRSRGAGTCCGR